MNRFYEDHSKEFKFGWEVEIMLTDNNYTPLFGDNLPFSLVQDVLSSIKTEEFTYLKEKYIGSGLTPYYIEGYDAELVNNTVRNVIVKGIEIRTPISFSIEESISLFEYYYNKAAISMEKKGLRLSCFGNHPFQPAFKGDRGNRSVIGWASAEVAMTTHGLVINISLPDDLEIHLDRESLNNRFAFSAPAMVLLAGNTPFRLGELWRPHGDPAISDRSYRRSFVRNTVYYRDDQHYRKEVTLFDMNNDLSLYSAYAAMSLGIILSFEELPVIPDRFSKENVRRVALHGYDAQLVDRHFDSLSPAEVAEKTLSVSARALTRHGFSEALLNPLWRLLSARKTPAEALIRSHENGASLISLIKSKSTLIRSESQNS